MTSAHLRLGFLEAKATPSSSSPLAPPVTTELRHYEEEDESSSGYSSTSSDEPTSERAARAKEQAPKKGKHRPVKRLMCRRAPFKRLEAIAEAEHKKRYSLPTSSSSVKSPQTSRPQSPITDAESTLSPRITLSPEPVSASSFSSQPQSAPMRTPQLSLSVPAVDSSANNDTSSPITLLSPRHIPAPGQASFSSPYSGASLNPDTHGEVVFRLLYVFTKSNTQWSYHPGLVDILANLYLTFLEPDWVKVQPRRRGSRRDAKLRRPVANGAWAEEQTYWAFCALARELEPCMVETKSIDLVLNCLGRRLHWADQPLSSALKENDLDPASPVFASQWVTLLLSRNLPRHYLLPAWDYLLSAPAGEAKLDALVDLSAAILVIGRKILLRANSLSLKRQYAESASRQSGGLWTDYDEAIAQIEPNDPALQLEFLRSLPLRQICEPDDVLRIADEMRKSRLEEKYIDLGLIEDREKYKKPKSTWESGGELLNRYANAETLNYVSKSSAKWTSDAMSKLSVVGAAGKQVAAQQGTSLWSSMKTRLASARGMAAPQSPSLVDQTLGARAASPLFDQNDAQDNLTSPPQSMFSPKQPSHLRDQNDSKTGLAGSSSISEKLANLASSFGAATTPSTPPPTNGAQTRKAAGVGGPRPLILSGVVGARRSSGSSMSRSSTADKRDSRDWTLSPPSGLRSPPNGPLASAGLDGGNGGSGLYKIGSGQGLPTRSRDSWSLESPEPKSLDKGKGKARAADEE